jgi:type I restriction enzyme S subunit
MFGDPAGNPRGWTLQTLGSVSLKFSDGPFGSNLKTEHYREAGVRVVRLQNIGVGRFADTDRVFISPEHFDELRKHECLPGDLMIATLGDPNLRACVIPSSTPVALNKADCVQMRPNASRANADFLCNLLNHPSTLRLAQDLMHGQTRVRISMGRLRELSVPIPPIELQEHFASRVSVIERLRAKQSVNDSHLDSLFASLQHRAFRGEL